MSSTESETWNDENSSTFLFFTQYHLIELQRVLDKDAPMNTKVGITSLYNHTAIGIPYICRVYNWRLPFFFGQLEPDFFFRSGRTLDSGYKHVSGEYLPVRRGKKSELGLSLQARNATAGPARICCIVVNVFSDSPTSGFCRLTCFTGYTVTFVHRTWPFRVRPA